jgi:membrane peptidoglycan carboxypeptidase
VIEESQRPKPVDALDPGAASITTDILAGNTNPRKNPFWGQFAITDGGVRRPATLKTGTSNEARDLNAYGFIAAPDDRGRKDGEYALVVGAWNGNSDNSLVSGRGGPLFSIDVTTYVWQGFMEESTKGWAINGFKVPNTIERASVDPWTGLASSSRNAVVELFLPGTAPTQGLPQDARCGEAVLTSAGFEDEHASWMAANQGWLARARRGPGTVGGPENTATAYFYNPLFNPYGRSWGPLLGGPGCKPTESPSPSIDPCASIVGVIDPSAEPVVCPSPSESTAPTEAPTEPPTEAPTEPPTPAPTPAPTAEPSQAEPSPAEPAAS